MGVITPVKRVWAYASEKGLKEAGRINCDARMREVFGEFQLDFSTISKALSPHLRVSETRGISSVGGRANAAKQGSDDGAELTLQASDELGQLMLSATELTVTANGWLHQSSGKLQLTMKEGLRWLGQYIKMHKLRSADKMYVLKHPELWQLLDADSNVDKMHLQKVSECFQKHLTRSTLGRSVPSGAGQSRSAQRREMPSAPHAEESSESEQSANFSEGDSPSESENESSSGDDDSDSSAASGSSESEKGFGVLSSRRSNNSCIASTSQPIPETSSPIPRSHLEDMGFSRDNIDAVLSEAELSNDEILGRLLELAKARRKVAAMPAESAKCAPPSDDSTGRSCRTSSTPVAKEIANEFLCPITQELMEDPVIANDGHSYERKAIEMWLQGSRRSPVTNMNMRSKQVIPNFNLKKLIQDHLAS